jgi:hypothetical protein
LYLVIHPLNYFPRLIYMTFTRAIMKCSLPPLHLGHSLQLLLQALNLATKFKTLSSATKVYKRKINGKIHKFHRLLLRVFLLPVHKNTLSPYLITYASCCGDVCQLTATSFVRAGPRVALVYTYAEKEGLSHIERRNLQVDLTLKVCILPRAANTFLEGRMLFSPDLRDSGDTTLSILGIGTK